MTLFLDFAFVLLIAVFFLWCLLELGKPSHWYEDGERMWPKFVVAVALLVILTVAAFLRDYYHAF